MFVKQLSSRYSKISQKFSIHRIENPPHPTFHRIFTCTSMLLSTGGGGENHLKLEEKKMQIFTHLIATSSTSPRSLHVVVAYKKFLIKANRKICSVIRKFTLLPSPPLPSTPLTFANTQTRTHKPFN